MKISESQLRRIIREELNRSNLMKESFWGKVKQFGRGTIFGKGQIDAQMCFYKLPEQERKSLIEGIAGKYQWYHTLKNLSKNKAQWENLKIPNTFEEILTLFSYAVFRDLDNNERFSDRASDLDPDNKEQLASFIKSWLTDFEGGRETNEFYAQGIKQIISKIESPQRNNRF